MEVDSSASSSSSTSCSTLLTGVDCALKSNILGKRKAFDQKLRCELDWMETELRAIKQRCGELQQKYEISVQQQRQQEDAEAEATVAAPIPIDTDATMILNDTTSSNNTTESYSPQKQPLITSSSSSTTTAATTKKSVLTSHTDVALSKVQNQLAELKEKKERREKERQEKDAKDQAIEQAKQAAAAVEKERQEQIERAARLAAEKEQAELAAAAAALAEKLAKEKEQARLVAAEEQRRVEAEKVKAAAAASAAAAAQAKALADAEMEKERLKIELQLAEQKKEAERVRQAKIEAAAAQAQAQAEKERQEKERAEREKLQSIRQMNVVAPPPSIPLPRGPYDSYELSDQEIWSEDEDADDARRAARKPIPKQYDTDGVEIEFTEDGKRLPRWAWKSQLPKRLAEMYSSQLDPDVIFPPIDPLACNLETIFAPVTPIRKKKIRPRTSSAHWIKDRLNQKEANQYQRVMGYKQQ